MRDEILLNLNNPQQLEKLYRTDQPTFKTAFNSLYPQVSDNPLAEGWYQRLNYSQDGVYWGTPSERVFVLAASLLAAFLAKLPEILSLNPELFYVRNVSFIVLPTIDCLFRLEK